MKSLELLLSDHRTLLVQGKYNKAKEIEVEIERQAIERVKNIFKNNYLYQSKAPSAKIIKKQEIEYVKKHPRSLKSFYIKKDIKTFKEGQTVETVSGARFIINAVDLPFLDVVDYNNGDKLCISTGGLKII